MSAWVPVCAGTPSGARCYEGSGLSSVRLARGDVEGARHLLDRAGEVAARSSATDVDDLIAAALRARLDVLHGDLGAAERWAKDRGWTEAALLPDL